MINKRYSPRLHRTLTTALAAACLAGSMISAAHGDRPATYWTVTAGDFYESFNWSLGSPNSTLDARIDNGGKATITTEAFQSIPYVYLGSAQTTSGTLEVSTGGIAAFTTMIVGALNATGTLNVVGGGKLTTFGGPIGSDYLGVGVATVDGPGSTWTITGSEMVLGGNGKGTAQLLNGGSLAVASGSGRVRLANHPLAEGNLQLGNGGAPGTVTASEIFNGEGRATVVFNHSSPFYSFAPKFTGLKTVNGFLNIQHTGTGTTVLTAPESNLAGTITVSAGTLVVNGNIKGSVRQVLVDEEIILEKNIGETSVLTGGTLGGTGFIEGKTTILGVLSPGVGPGVLKFGGDLVLESAGKVRIELGGILRGTLFDGVDVDGVLAYGGTLEIVLTNGFLPDEGDTFDLFDGFESQTGDFSNILFTAEDYAGIFDPVTGVLTVVPEPGTIGLLICAALPLAMRRRTATSPKFKE